MESYDIFLSYASVDNTDLAEPYGSQTQWVRCFKVALQQALDRNLGRTGESKWFFDAQNIKTGDNIDEVLLPALKNTKLFVAIASPGYLDENARACEMERQYFIKLLGANPSGAKRIFTVLLDEAIRKDWEAATFDGVRCFPFYEKDRSTGYCMRLGEGKISQQFIQQVEVLARELAARIRELTAEAEKAAPSPSLPHSPAAAATAPVSAPTPAPADKPRGTVVLAAVPGEIEDQRTEIAEFLTKDGWRVLPEDNVCAATLADCRGETRALCEDAVLFIQLLSRFPWRPNEFDRAQFEGAQDSQKPFLRFRSDDFAMEAISNLKHREWLQQFDVAARSLPTIKDEIQDRLKKLVQKSTAPALPTGADDEAESAFITMSVASVDRGTLGRALTQRLEQDGVYSLIPSEPLPSFEDCLLRDHGLLTVFGNEPYARVEQVLLGWREVLAKHRRKRKATPPIAIYVSDPPPLDKQSAINMSLPGMTIISWNDEDAMRKFVTDVRAYNQQMTAMETQEVRS